MLFSISNYGNAQITDLKDGDLLFQDIRCGGLCDAIEAVTPSLQGKKFSHLGLVCRVDDITYVIEAIGKDVHLTPLKSFMERSTDSAGNPRIVVGRLKKEYQSLNKKAIKFAFRQIHMPYDDEFIYNNGKYYCSELVYDAYKYANGNKPFFTLYPMTFADPDTKQYFPAWIDYYKDLKMDIPEGKPGCNPGGIANSDKIDIIKSLY